MTERKYLVIGGAGFLGSHLVQELLSRGEQSVAVYDLNEPKDEAEKFPGVKYHRGDINDEDTLVAVLQEVRCHFFLDCSSYL